MGMLDKIRKLELDDIMEFRDHGNVENAPEEIVHYLQEMEKVLGMHRAGNIYGSRDAIINHLIKFNGYSHYLAAKLHDNTMEYFYADRAISKNAYRNIIAELMHKGINTAFALAKDSADVVRALKELPNMAKVLGLDQADKEEFPKELLQRPIKLYTSYAEDLRMQPIDRYELGRVIDGLKEHGLSDSEIEKAKRDSQLLPVKIFEE